MGKIGVPVDQIFGDNAWNLYNFQYYCNVTEPTPRSVDHRLFHYPQSFGCSERVKHFHHVQLKVMMYCPIGINYLQLASR